MAKLPIDLVHLESKLQELGISMLGELRLTPDLIPENSSHLVGQYAVLIGNKGGEMWSPFVSSEEFHDGLPDPMDRWTRRSIDSIVQPFNIKAAYPFDVPYWPFQRLAKAACQLEASPLGMLIHPEYGLWQAYRAVLLVESKPENSSLFRGFFSAANKVIHPCDSCEDKPCLAACPAEAFENYSFSVDRCFAHLDSGTDPECMNLGCRARDACPVGTEHRYSIEQIRFHMKAFKK